MVALNLCTRLILQDRLLQLLQPRRYLMVIAAIITSLMSLLSHRPHIIDFTQSSWAAAAVMHRTSLKLPTFPDDAQQFHTDLQDTNTQQTHGDVSSSHIATPLTKIADGLQVCSLRYID